MAQLTSLLPDLEVKRGATHRVYGGGIRADGLIEEIFKLGVHSKAESVQRLEPVG